MDNHGHRWSSVSTCGYSEVGGCFVSHLMRSDEVLTTKLYGPMVGEPMNLEDKKSASLCNICDCMDP